uniref:Variant surface glycoprotein n=1 Tax=Trypanosoma brucei TaxID=5691 RepID=S5G4B8_9TRYP|nr:variant surface glycoprotein [Trypanosoma brucei]
MHTIFPAALLAGYVVAFVAADATNTLAHDSTLWCHDIQYLEAILAAIDKEMNNRQKQLQVDAELIAKWKLAEAAAEQWHERRKYTALSVVIATLASKNSEAATEYLSAAAEAKKAINRRLEALQLVARATSALKQTVTGAPQAASANAACQGSTEYASEAEFTCAPPEAGELKTAEVQTKLHTATHIKLTSFKALNELVAAPKITITATAGTTPFASPGQTPGTCQTSGGQNIAAGTNHVQYAVSSATVLKTQTPAAQPIDSDSERPEEPTAKKATVTAWLDIKFVTAALKNLKTAYNQKQIDLSQATHSTLAALPGFKTVIANLFVGAEPPANNQETEYNNKIADIIKQTYGPEPGDFKRKFVTELADQDVRYNKSGNEQEKKLGALSKDADLSIALSFMINKRHESQLQKAAKAVSTVPKQNCQSKTKDECKDACEWKGTDDKGECKPKEAGTENTATTGTGEKTKEGAASEGKKCSEKKSEGECKDGCKWEGKECKDSSILLNKQFAISVVSAAFVALLF